MNISDDYKEKYLTALKEYEEAEKKAKTINSKLSATSIKFEAILLTNEDFEILGNRSMAWDKFLEIARHPY